MTEEQRKEYVEFAGRTLAKLQQAMGKQPKPGTYILFKSGEDAIRYRQIVQENPELSLFKGNGYTLDAPTQ